MRRIIDVRLHHHHARTVGHQREHIDKACGWRHLAVEVVLGAVADAVEREVAVLAVVQDPQAVGLTGACEVFLRIVRGHHLAHNGQILRDQRAHLRLHGCNELLRHLLPHEHDVQALAEGVLDAHVGVRAQAVRCGEEQQLQRALVDAAALLVGVGQDPRVGVLHHRVVQRIGAALHADAQRRAHPILLREQLQRIQPANAHLAADLISIQLQVQHQSLPSSGLVHSLYHKPQVCAREAMHSPKRAKGTEPERARFLDSSGIIRRSW